MQVAVAQRFEAGFPALSFAGIAADEMAVIVSASAAAQAAFSGPAEDLIGFRSLSLQFVAVRCSSLQFSVLFDMI